MQNFRGKNKEGGNFGDFDIMLAENSVRWLALCTTINFTIFKTAAPLQTPRLWRISKQVS